MRREIAAMTKAMKGLWIFLLSLCLCLCAPALTPQRASAVLEIGKVLTTTSTTPVALMEVSQITAATSTGGCYISGYDWHDSQGWTATGTFGTEVYRVTITVSAADGYYFSENVAVYLNNEPAAFDMSTDFRTLTLYRDYSPAQWAPTVIKNPGSETVEVGGFASFVATATYVKSYAWEIMSPDGGTRCPCYELPAYFEGVSTSEDGYEKMNIYNIPAELDGWRVRCLFSGYGGDVYSGYAIINVKHDEPEPTLTPTPKPSAEPGPGASPSPEATPGPDGHIHSFSVAWSYDAQSHWKQCDCGERSEQAAHSMTWTPLAKATKKTPATEQGVCSVCGYSETRSVAAAEGEGGALRYIVWGIGGAVGLIVVAVIIDSAVSSRRRRRRRRR